MKRRTLFHIYSLVDEIQILDANAEDEKWSDSFLCAVLFWFKTLTDCIDSDCDYSLLTLHCNTSWAKACRNTELLFPIL